MFITTRSNKVAEIVERSEFIKKRKAIAQKAIATQKSEIEKNWDYIKKTESIRSRNFEFNEYSSHRKLINRLKDKPWSGSRCFIIGGGPSLKGFDFSQLSNEFTIAINRAHEFIKNPSIIFFIDEDGFYNELMKGSFGQKAINRFNTNQSIRISLNISGRNYEENIHSIPISKMPEMTFDLKDGLHDGGNSGYAALNLAVCLGAETIYLLGYDMKGDGKGRQTWFHGGYKKIGKEKNYKDWIKHFEKVAPILKNKGIKVINLNPDSKLKCFDFGKFEKPEREMITAITPTGDRPLAFALCQQWMRNQTRQPDQWIVVDDGKVPLKPFVSMQYVRREPQLDDPQHTLFLNLKAAVPLIKGDKIVIIEDDEYYAPEYIEEMVRRLTQHEVVGIGRSKYYHLPTGSYFQISNTTHASLAETGFRSSIMPELSGLWDGDSSLDMRLWQKIGPPRSLLFVDTIKPLYLGIKGLPGRAGIGAGHNPALYRGRAKDTTDRAMLKKWVPQDYQVYLDILNGKLTSENYRSYFPNVSNITGITVVQDTKDLIERAYNSIRNFHPDMPIIIIDGSTPGDPCASYVRGLASDVTTIISLGYNIGHGRGLCMGIDKVETPYALIFDSDIEMLKSPVQAMFEMMEEDTFGVGHIEEKTAFDGFEWGWPGHKTNGWMSYLHPFFQLIDIKNYRKFYPYVHHGAPCYLTMLDIHKRGLSNKILKQFPGLGHTSGKGLNWMPVPGEHIRHDPGSTSKARTGKNARAIEGGWVINMGQV